MSDEAFVILLLIGINLYFLISYLIAERHRHLRTCNTCIYCIHNKEWNIYHCIRYYSIGEVVIPDVDGPYCKDYVGIKEYF